MRPVAPRRNQFAAVEAHLFNLVSGADAPERETEEVPGLTQIFDPGRRLLAAFGLAGKGIAVIGPDRRLTGVLEPGCGPMDSRGGRSYTSRRS